MSFDKCIVVSRILGTMLVEGKREVTAPIYTNLTREDLIGDGLSINHIPIEDCYFSSMKSNT